MAVAAICYTVAAAWASAVLIDMTLKWYKRRSLTKARGYSEPPSERPWDIFGVAKILIAARHLVNATTLPDADKSFARFGTTFSAKFLSQRVLFTCHPENLRHVFVPGFNDFDSSKGLRDHLFAPITPNGIFALDGAHWKAARGLYRDFFSRTRDIFNPILLEKAFKSLQERIPIGETVDLQPLFLLAVMDTTSAFALGESLDSLDKNQSAEKREVMYALKNAKRIMARNGFLGPLHHFLGKKEYLKSCEIIHTYVEGLIRKRLGEKFAGVQKSTDKRCLLNNLCEISDNVGDIRDGVVTVMIAGIDTINTLLSTTFFLLSRNKRVLTKLRKEIMDVTKGEIPTFDDLRAMPYLRAVFNEMMRVYPPVPFNAKIANKDTFLPAGGGPDGQSPLLVLKGDRVIFSSWGSHRSLEYFGNDAHEFVPERWENLKAESLGFIPFNLGPRTCPGQHIAMTHASYIAVRFLQTYENVHSRDDRDFVEHMGLNLSNANGTRVALT